MPCFFSLYLQGKEKNKHYQEEFLMVRQQRKEINFNNRDGLIKSKKDSGLDIKNLKTHNQSLFVKWLPRYNLETKAL